MTISALFYNIIRININAFIYALIYVFTDNIANVQVIHIANIYGRNTNVFLIY